MAKVSGNSKGVGNGNGNGNQLAGPPGLAGTTPGQSGNTPGQGGTSPPGQTGATPGQNQAPTDIQIGGSSVDENATGATIGALTVVDPNDGGAHTFTVSDQRFEVVGGWLKLKDGISLDYETEHSVALSVTTTDSLGLSFTKQFTIAVGNVNEQPAIVTASTIATGAINELADTTGSATLDSASGSIAFSDVDLGDTHTVSQSGPTFSWSGGTLTAEQVQALTAAGSLTLTETDSTGSGSGSVAWNYAVTDGALDFLAEGETLTVSYGVTVTDNGGASAAQSVTVTINGTADGPQNTAPVAVDDLVVGSTAVQPGAPISFEPGTYSWNAYGIETADGFQFTNADGFPYFSQSNLITTFWGVDGGQALYSDGARFDDLSAVDTRPLEMTRVDGGTFSLIGGNFTSWNNNYPNDSLAGRIETVTGYLDGVQVAQQSFQVPDGYYVSRLNEVDLTDPGFGSVDRVEFSLVAALTNSNDYFAYQFIDNLQTATMVSSANTEDQVISGIDVLANDTDDGAPGNLSIAQFSTTSAMGAAITLNQDGTFTYDPTGSAALQALNTGDAVDDTFTYAVQDAFGAVSNTATVTVHLNGVDEAPDNDGPLFGAPIALPQGSYAGFVAVGDVNSDGTPDLAFASQVDHVAVLLGNGDGTFADPTTFAVGSNPTAAAIADLNGDGNADLVVTNAFSNDVSVLLGGGDGTFGAATNFAVGALPRALAIADLNGDGNADIATANHQSGSVSVLLGNGDGTFDAATSYAAGGITRAIAIGDLNGDGSLDLAAVNESTNNVSVLLGNGDGTFNAATNFGVGNHPTSVAIGDLNGDGALDLAVTNYNDSTVSVLLNNGNGTFAAANNLAAVSTTSSVAMADLDGDGNLDLAVTGLYTSSVAVLLGNGDGSFDAAISFATGEMPETLAIVDLNGDGGLDLAMNGSILLNGNSGGASVQLTGVTPGTDDPALLA